MDEPTFFEDEASEAEASEAEAKKYPFPLAGDLPPPTHIDPNAPPPEEPAPETPVLRPYLKASDPNTWDKPDDISWANYSLHPNTPLSNRQREIARLAFLGKSVNYIAESVGYSSQWVSRILQNDKIKAEIDRMRDLAFERTVSDRLRELTPQALTTLEEGLTQGKLTDRTSVARWLIEKVDGKPVQKSETQNNTLDRFLDVLKEMKHRGETLDVTPTKSTQEVSAAKPGEAAADSVKRLDWDTWMEGNL